MTSLLVQQAAELKDSYEILFDQALVFVISTPSRPRLCICYSFAQEKYQGLFFADPISHISQIIKLGMLECCGSSPDRAHTVCTRLGL